jgi:hypothetical protein
VSFKPEAYASSLSKGGTLILLEDMIISENIESMGQYCVLKLFNALIFKYEFLLNWSSGFGNVNLPKLII